jgi:Secretory lipase
MSGLSRALRCALFFVAACGWVFSATAGASSGASAPPGSVVSASPLNKKLWIPRTTSTAFRLVYVTSDARGTRALSSGELFVPKGKAPSGGWPVIAWAHGTSGLGDRCAPSVVGPAEPQRDFPVLTGYMRQGYAVVATDYAGLGTPGLPAYLNGRSEAHNIVDMVKAGRAYARAHLRPSSRLARKWVVVGQSQGAGAAIYAARYATSFGGRGLDYRGAVGTGTPAGIENVVDAIGPGFPTLSGGTTAYLLYIFASLRSVYPKLGINTILTPTGRKHVQQAETTCINAFAHDLQGVAFSPFFSRPVSTLPGVARVLDVYMKMPEKGFDKPFFMAHGLKDTDVPYALTAPYVAKLKANNQPLTFKLYNTDHSGTLIASQPAAHAFVRRLFGSS